jgi:hypothetical protein
MRFSTDRSARRRLQRSDDTFGACGGQRDEKPNHRGHSAHSGFASGIASARNNNSMNEG